MKTRMEKYYSDGNNILSRSTKNKELYKEVNDTELENFDLNSNVSILGNNSKNIDLDKIHEMLDKKYKEPPKKRIPLHVEREPETEMSLDETREYDINRILDKAKEDKEVDYEVDRLKKLRNTQYDILNNLDLEPTTLEDASDITREQAKLMDLINTITSKELANDIKKEEEKQAQLNKEEISLEDIKEDLEELDPLDILTDLRGEDENTVTLGAIKEDILDKAINSNKGAKDSSSDIKTKEFNVDIKKEEKNSDDAIDSIFNTTNSLQFSQSDFDDFNDLKDDMKAAKIIIKILIILIIVAFVVGCVFLANNIFDLGLI